MPPTGFPMGNPMGAGPPNFDPAVVDGLMADTGVSMPDSYRQPGMFENMGGFMGRHQRLATGLDNAFIAVSQMGPTGPTIGDNISNVARGVLGVMPYRQQYMAQQAMLPIQMAGQIMGLEEKKAQMGELKARGDYWANANASRESIANTKAEGQMNAAAMRQNMVGAQHMRLGDNGKVQEPYIDPNDPTFQVKWRDTNADPVEFKREQTKSKVSEGFGGGELGMMMATNLAGIFGDKLDEARANPGKPMLKDANGQMLSYMDVANHVHAHLQQQSSGFQSGARHDNAIPETTRYTKVAEQGDKDFKNGSYDDKHLDPEAEAERQMALAANSGGKVDLKAARQQGSSQVQHRQEYMDALRNAKNEWDAQSPDFQVAHPFAQWALKSKGVNTGTRTYTPGGIPTQPQIGPAGNIVPPQPNMPGQTMPGQQQRTATNPLGLPGIQ